MSGELISDHYDNVDTAHISCSCLYVIFVTLILPLFCQWDSKNHLKLFD